MVDDKSVSLKIYFVLFIFVLFIVILPIGVYYIDNYWDKGLDYMTYPIIVLLAIMFASIIVLGIVLLTLIPVEKYIKKLMKDPYSIKKIKIGVDEIHMHIFKNAIYFCTVRIKNLNPDFFTIVVPLDTPLSFFNKSNRRIVGDGNETIITKLPKGIWDLHTEFDDGKNSLIVKVNVKNLKSDENILSLIESIKNKIENMKYSDENIKKIHHEMAAVNQFMKSYVCMKCGNLIPPSRLKELCSVDSRPHETKLILLDLHVPYSKVKKISPFLVVSLISLLALEIYFLSSWISDEMLILIGVIEGIIFVFSMGYYFQHILNFKNMLRHFEAKKRYIFETLGKDDTQSNRSESENVHR